MDKESSIITFDRIVRNDASFPWICDDIFYDVIVPFCTRNNCKMCRKWVLNDGVMFACFRIDHTLCFWCRHRAKWPL